MRLQDLKNPFLKGVSISPQESAAATVSGDWVDVSDVIGPVAADYVTGSASGSPTGQSHVVKIREADDDSGTNAQDISGATATVDADGTVTTIQAKNRSKPFVQLQAVITFTGGSTPKNVVSGVVYGQKERY